MKRSNLKPQTIIFSVSRAQNSVADNALKSTAVQGLMDSFNVSFKLVIGYFAGFQERSYVVSASHEKLVRILCEEAEQDNYLYLDEYRNAYLVDLADNDETRRPIGKWVHSHAVPEGDYTRDGEHYYEVV